MKRYSVAAALFLALVAGGCGSSGKGPANPEETPVVSQEEVRDAYTKGMPPHIKQMYESRLKK
jgi:hypothetical protein